MENGSKQLLKELILALAAPCQWELTILQTAPDSNSVFTAIGIISEISTNMRLFLQRNTYAYGLALHQATTKVQRKNLSESPKPDATLSRYLCSVPMLLLSEKSILDSVYSFYFFINIHRIKVESEVTRQNYFFYSSPVLQNICQQYTLQIQPKVHFLSPAEPYR